MKAKSLFTGVIVLAVFSLSGCSTLEHMLPPTPQEVAAQQLAKQKQQQAKCNHADVLLSDLKKPVSKRTYSLKPGVVCHD